MPNQDPPAAFRFTIERGNDTIGAFTECEMPSFELDTQEVKEGGQNDYAHTLPGPAKAGRITLKHGVMTDDTLLEWYFKVIEGKLDDAMQSVTVIMFSGDLKPMYRFEFDRAYPIKWQGPSFKAGDSAVAIESIELAHHGVTIQIFT